ncbi:FecR family protein [Methylocystis parvus]|uniref:FecR domain-containing protein n=1 Tax=Methylocystis parvus TaxID=134 RepID=A0A6B8M0M4_9HYPH|nr:FecR family protein [Methylocystis parvus]QGM98347.1 FecR domain-containing protein [Methylocystis parvus]WBK01324.1 FecR family protein [Methylocystis parvus OBBP]
MRNLTLSFSALLALCAPAKAEQTPANANIGSATLIEKVVEGLTAERNMRLKAGDAVYFNELLTTGQESQGKFIFDDRATLQMGPQSQVRLDNFVYAGNSGGAPAVAFNVTKGALRLISATGAHKPYEVRTNRTTIGVRGTSFAVRSNDLRTDAVLYEGVIDVCLPNGGACRTLDKPCTTISVTDAGFVETRAVGARDWTFDEECRPAPAPIRKRRHGAAEPPPSPPPVVAPRRAALQDPEPPRRTVRVEPPRESEAPPRKVRAAHVEPPRTEIARPAPPPPRVVAEPVRPRWPRRPHPPVYEDAEDYTPVYPAQRFPVRPPIIFGGGLFRPHFPGGGWGGSYGGARYPQRPWGGSMGGNMGGGGYGGMAQRWGRY